MSNEKFKDLVLGEDEELSEEFEAEFESGLEEGESAEIEEDEE